MIARTWTGTVRRSDADEYAEYIRETGFAEYGQTPGNCGAWMLRRDEGERTEFITLSLWGPRMRSALSLGTTSRPRFFILKTSVI
jgi:hypothetical protein